MMTMASEPLQVIKTQVLTCDPSSIAFDTTSSHPTISCAETSHALQLASESLSALQCVVFPTETVYGLGALALNSEASSKIFSTKGRPADNPLIVHVSSLSMLHALLPKDYILSDAYEVLIKQFWPGALTLLFPSYCMKIPSIITANHPTVAIRMPSHPVARALIALTNAPLAAPSANASGKPSPTKASHALRDLDGKVNFILDGGACGVGLESTVIDGLHEDGNIRILRPGGITVEEIQRVIQANMSTCELIPKVLVHKRDYADEAMESAPTTPGMKYRHYSPSVPVTLLLTQSSPPKGIMPVSATSFLASIDDGLLKVGILTPSDSPLATYPLKSEFPSIQWRVYMLGPISDPAITAQRLFDGLLTLENEGVGMIIIEEISEDNEGLAVMNRIRKAAGETRWVTFQ